MQSTWTININAFTFYTRLLDEIKAVFILMPRKKQHAAKNGFIEEIWKVDHGALRCFFFAASGLSICGH